MQAVKLHQQNLNWGRQLTEVFLINGCKTVVVTKERKGKEEYLYSAILVSCHTHKALRWITQFYLQITPCLPFRHKR